MPTTKLAAPITMSLHVANGYLSTRVGTAYPTKSGGFTLRFWHKHSALSALRGLQIVAHPRKTPKGAATHNVYVVTEGGQPWDLVGTGFLNNDASVGIAFRKRAFPELLSTSFRIGTLRPMPRREPQAQTSTASSRQAPPATSAPAADDSAPEAKPERHGGVHTF